jgi:aconitate hydratase
MHAQTPTAPHVANPVAPQPGDHPFAATRLPFAPGPGKAGALYSLPALGRLLGRDLSRLPVSIRIVLEAVLRHCDNRTVMAAQVEALAAWQPAAPRLQEIPFKVARVLLQDFTGVPLLADLAAMRDAAAALGRDPALIEPLVPVDLVVDHSVMIDHWGTHQALDQNMALEFDRNHERYQFIKWGTQAFQRLQVVPPGFGIVHQVNLEYLARGVHRSDKARGELQLYYPDSLVGTDSHSTMVNGIGVVGWGVGGIEAEAAMLGQPVNLLTPDVVGVELTGQLRDGVTATDLVLALTEQLRAAKVVDQFVEFFGAGTAALDATDRATIANMAPEYGATMGFFPVDEQTLAYLRGTGRARAEVTAVEAYFRAQGLFGVPRRGQIDYSRVLRLDLTTVEPSLAGPKRPQDRIALGNVASRFQHLLTLPGPDGYQLPAAQMGRAVTAGAPTKAAPALTLRDGDVLIAAITSCTNTSNPGVMLAAGLLAQKAVARGLTVPAHIKTSLAPGSRVVTDYLDQAGLLKPLRKLGFHVAAYGCTTCIGNSGPLAPAIEQALADSGLVGAAVLSGNRNFEARIHPLIKANFLASPPLVVAYALAGTLTRDLMTEPVGLDPQGKPVFLGELWPSRAEVQALMKLALDPGAYRKRYALVTERPGALWKAIGSSRGQTYAWPASRYIARPPYFERMALQPTAQALGVQGARILLLLGDSVTTDHISPAGNIAADSPAGRWLQDGGVAPADFNSYGARRGHHEVMVRGTFANVRLKNQLLPPGPDGRAIEGGLTVLHQAGPGQGTVMPVYDAAQAYQAADTPTVVFAGSEYGTGSSRDWAAKGTRLLGVRAVVARSFERIHRANLVGMGVLPLQFKAGDSWQALALTGAERIDIVIDGELTPQRDAVLVVHRADGQALQLPLTLRVDTAAEVDCLRQGGLLPQVLRQLLAGTSGVPATQPGT